jgi:hypothetical protein
MGLGASRGQDRFSVFQPRMNAHRKTRAESEGDYGSKSAEPDLQSVSHEPREEGKVGGESSVSRHAAILAATEPMEIYEAAP